MQELKQQLIKAAQERYITIYPCSRFEDFEQCFTMNSGRLLFWFNTEDQSTHIISADELVAA